MEKFLEELLEHDVINATTKQQIAEEWNKQLQDARQRESQRVRKELANRYKLDRSRLVEALQKMTTDAITVEFGELKEDIKRFRKLKAQYAKKLTEARSEAHKKASRALGVIGRVLRKEILEFRKDRADQKRVSATLIEEIQAKGIRDRERLIERGAVVLENMSRRVLEKFIAEAKTDIKTAKENDFGRRIYESFSSEFAANQFNINPKAKQQARKLTKIVNENLHLRTQLAEQQRLHYQRLQTVEKQKTQVTENVNRERTIERLVSNLKGPQRKQMRKLLENTSTPKLEASYRTFLPMVVSPPKQIENKPTRLIESSNFSTGNSKSVEQIEDSEIAALRRRLPSAKD